MAFDRSKGEPELALDQIQGDVLVGLQKDAQWFVGFSIVDVPAFGAFLRHLVPSITTTRQVLEREFIIEALSKTGIRLRLPFVGVNISFTADGLRTLGVDVGGIKDEAFKAGLAAHSLSLNDPTDGEGAPASWRLGKPQEKLHGLLLVTGPDKAHVDGALDRVMALAGKSWDPFFKELGETRPGAERGHEHFGFLDGVSQPGVRGQIDTFFPFRKFLMPSHNPKDAGQALPGQDLLWPGAFVFGYPSQQPTDIAAPGTPSDGGLPWMKNGSLQVFRRLRQLVPEFSQFVEQQAEALKIAPSALLGARMVGRWKSGAPIELSDKADNPVLGPDRMKNNDFEFGGDPAGLKCPFAGHIRKAYPRDDITPAATGNDDEARRSSSEANTETHRIMRAGIAFGPEVTPQEDASKQSSEQRGLMFICYQTSIADQFEFITKFWVDNPAFAPASDGKAGHDPIIGQAAPPGRARSFGGANGNGNADPPLQLPSDFVVPTGGAYFFVPSIDALTHTLASPAG